MSEDKRKIEQDRRRTWTKRARNDRRAQQNKNWMLPLYVTEAREGSDRRSVFKAAPERQVKLPLLPKIFRIRNVYLKVTDMDVAREFYSSFLQIAPKKDGNVWCEFPLGNMSFGLSLITGKGEKPVTGSNFVPVFEFADSEIYNYVQRAKTLGAKVISDSISEGHGNAILMADPSGNEFEISRQHD